jgi:hypothetical protein
VEFRELLDMKIKNYGLQWLLAVGLSLMYWLNGGLAVANVGLRETAPVDRPKLMS